MKTKRLPTNKHKGMVVYCSECKRNFSYTRKKQDNGKIIEPVCGKKPVGYSKCKFKDKHAYKVKLHISGTSNKQTSKVLDADSYEEAVIKAIEFKNGFDSKIKEYSLSYNKQNTQRVYLLQAQIAYFEFLENIGVPEHEQKERSKESKDQQFRALSKFNEAIVSYGIIKEIILLDQISSKHVEMFHKYLSGYANVTYNNYIKNLRTFFKWAIAEYTLRIKNPFEAVVLKKSLYNKETINEDEFTKLLQIITPEKGRVIERYANSVKHRNYYKPYLKDLLLLALHTGGRREEVVSMRWDMIVEVENIPTYIVVKNLKVERIKKDDNVAPKIIPITPQLMQVLESLGYAEHKDSNEHIVCSDRRKKTNKTLMDEMSRGFTHFYKMLNTGRDLQLKSLRKTYLTYVNQAMQGDTKSLSSHSSNDVLKKHYIDPKIISKAVKNVKIFG